MITISACLIVKNEEKVLTRCLECVQRIADEIIIVDTGSTDKTREIARAYTDKIYDFTWIHDFAAARNFSFSKATKDYIYVVDADEIIDEKNVSRFLALKMAMLSEIEVVQMYYCNQLEFNTTYNFDKEYRPKLYKRLREFRWRDPIHESVCLDPVIFDSEIEIIHKPYEGHATRDFHLYQHRIKLGDKLSGKLVSMYARELYVAGRDEDFIEGYDYFLETMEREDLTLEEIKRCHCVALRGARLRKERESFFKISLKSLAGKDVPAEVCYELGEYYLEAKDAREASLWFYNAAFESEAELNLHYSGDYPLTKLVTCFELLGNLEEARAYEVKAAFWCKANMERTNASSDE